MRILGIYAITNKSNGKTYVGSSVNIRSRWNGHRMDLSKNRHHNPKLQAAWNKYGDDGFEFSVLELVDSPELLLEREQYWIDRLCSFERGYNAKPLARNMFGFRHSQESRARMSAKRAGRQHRELTRLKIGLSQVGKRLSDETKRKIRQAAQGRRASEETRRRMSEAKTGKKLSQDAIEKSSEARRGKPLSDSHRANIRLARLAYLERMKTENPGALKQSREHVAKREAARLATLAAKKAKLAEQQARLQ